ncbi:MAG: right-handed parallel beta-helix repeat-containing protein [Candidatus Hermodarchaeota archaeon]
MNSTKKITIILITLIFLSLLINRVNLNSKSIKIKTNANSKDQIEKIPKSSGYWNLTGSQILIDDRLSTKNWTYTASIYPWCSGSGTWNDPYIIENVWIDGQGLGSCIEIRYSSKYFIIRNCTLSNSGSVSDADGGIKLLEVDNGKLINNTCSNNKANGIFLYHGMHINISGNLINSNDQCGLKSIISYHNIFTLNNISHNSNGIYLTGEPNNTISDNIINNNYNNGIILNGTRKTNILNNSIHNNNNSGIYVNQCIDIIISNNEIYNNNYSGVEIDNTQGIIISNNSISSNEYGIYLERYYSNTIFDNTVSFNRDTGIVILNSINNNIIKNNVNNNEIGIYFENSNSNYIMENNINNNTNWGLYLVKSNYNSISNNEVCDNFKPLEEVECEGNTFNNNNWCIDKNGFPPEIVVIIVISIAGIIFAVGMIVFRRKTSKKRLISKSILSSQELEELQKTEAEVSVEKEHHVCIVHRGKIVGAIYLCPKCETYYCMKCATVLKKKGETCWACHNKIELK